MSLPGQANSGPSTGPSASGPDRKGSVKRARQLLEAGVRPTQEKPQALRQPPMPPAARNIAHQTQWPLPESGLQPRPLNPHQPRFMTPSGPPPLRPPRPSEVPSQIPSPSVYSVRSGESPEPSFSVNYPNPYPYPTPSVRSFSHPNPRHQQQQFQPSTNNGAISPSSTIDISSRISVGTDELFRNSTHSAFSNLPMPPVPPSEPPPPVQSRRQGAGLHIPPNARRSRARKSSVSPIPEEIPNPRQTLGSYASSRVIPSSWGSGPAESEILGAYLDDGSSDDEEDELKHDGSKDEANLVRSASVGKRHKPTMRTIMRSNPNSEVSVPDLPASPVSQQRELDHNRTAGLTIPTTVAAAGGTAMAQNDRLMRIRTPSPVCRGSISSLSGESYVDPEKPRFAKYEEQNTYRGALEKELEDLPRAAPTMSDKRPNGRKPPRLDLEAVRGAEARGSLSSLTDLIRRATKLASNLDRGRTSSRADLAGAGADFREQGNRGRTSGSLSDILASFPNPSVLTPDTRSSWPVFFGRSHLRNVEPLASHDDIPEDPAPRRKCCGMPRRWFILLCILIFIIVILAVLLPVFLVAVPRENASQSCSHTTPCHNGGVSVSGGTECSCVCAEGYMGSQCSLSGDSSCVTAEVNNGSINKNTTMGSSIPTLLDRSQQKFGIDLDGVTIMALFSMNNVSCRTENALVSFSEISQSGDTGTARRSTEFPGQGELGAPIKNRETPMIPRPSRSIEIAPSSNVIRERSLATSNGIYYDSASTTSSARVSSTNDDTSATSTIATATTTKTGVTSTSASVPSEVINFSRVAVLYILEKTGSFNSAQESETQIQTYLIDSYNSAAHPAVKVLEWYELDFENKTISTG
ncbi:hypothetical protein N7478_001563 [Penicillium angulare]|uniref:uncharacterized protein n=1 Tax=Penicillium angulare TaxID=116970 RepID=UPI0025405E85|nr:uncharacterized protein N7478_001563 [Penicillium angulare]KAJ5288533.1 hypothetical protein N7478_001563 [Penicillium angulare]